MIRYSKNPLFYKYFISYIIVLAIPVMCFGALLYSRINKNYREEIENYRNINSNQLVNTFDNEFKIANSIALRIVFDRSMSKAVIKQNEYHAKLMIDTLRKYVQESNIINDIYVYFNNEDIVYSSKGTMKIDTMFETGFTFTKDEEEMFLSLLNCRSGPYTGIVGDSDVVVSVFTVPYNSSSPYGTVTIITNRKSIGKILGIDEKNDFSFSVLSDKGEIVSYFGTLPENDILEKNKYGDDNIYSDKSDYLIHSRSKTTGFEYFTIYPQRSINSVFNDDISTLVIFFLVILFCIYIAAIMASRNYKPIRNIIDKFFDNAQRKAGRDINELEYINDLIGDALENNRKLLSRIDEQLPFIKEQILLMLIKGETINGNLARDLLTSSGIEFLYDYFIVASISISNYSKNEVLSARVSNIIKLSLSEEELNLKGYIIELLRGDRVIILNGDSKYLDKEFLYKKLGVIQRAIREQLKIKTNIGIGSIVDSLEYVAVSFEEAQYALNYMFVNGYGYILFYNDLINDRNNVFWFPTEEIVNLSNLLKQGNCFRSMECVREIFLNVKNRNISPGVSRSIGFGIINTIIRVINDFNISGLNKDLENISSYESLEELESGLTGIIQNVCAYFNDFKSNRNMQLKVELIKYINEHFTDPGLSLELLADEFNYTDKYISKFLYQNTGYKFADYIKRLRIDYAKSLLKQTENTVKEIVEMSGYNDPSSFIRTFSNLEGVTPGKYRELNK